jgi:CBS domain containing-hemolysin-like protein
MKEKENKFSNNKSDFIPKGLFFELLDWFLGKIIKPKPVTLEDSVNELIKEHDLRDTIHTEERAMLQNFIDFKDLRAHEVMIPRTYIIGIAYDASFDELKEKFIKEGHTRVPVFKESLDEISGFVHMKDFVPYIGKESEFKISLVIRELLYAPRSMKVIDLLVKMRLSGIHIAIVLDEYGGTDGLVTIENLVEEIIGDIRDEHDSQEEPELVKAVGEGYVIDGKAKIEEIEERFNLNLASEDDSFETFGGFILAYLGRIPKRGEIIKHASGMVIEIIDADIRKIKTAKVKISNI